MNDLAPIPDGNYLTLGGFPLRLIVVLQINSVRAAVQTFHRYAPVALVANHARPAAVGAAFQFPLCCLVHQVDLQLQILFAQENRATSPAFPPFCALVPRRGVID